MGISVYLLVAMILTPTPMGFARFFGQAFIFGYPKPEAAQVASAAIRDALSRLPAISLVRLVFFNDSDAQTFVAHQRFE